MTAQLVIILRDAPPALDAPPEIRIDRDAVIARPEEGEWRERAFGAIGGQPRHRHALNSIGRLTSMIHRAEIRPGLVDMRAGVAVSADQDRLGQIMIDIEILAPGGESRALDLGDLLKGVHQRHGARGGPSLHPHDRFATGTDAREIEHQKVIAIDLLIGHDLKPLDGLGPSLSCVRNLEPDDLGSGAIEVPGVAHRCVLGMIEVRMGVIENYAHRRHIVPVDEHHVVVIAAADAGAVEEQIE